MPEEKRWLPSYRMFPRDWGQHPYKKMLMTPILTFLGGIFAFAVTSSIAAILQIFVFNPPVSNEWAPITESALRGRQVFVSNGCVFCHSGFTRPQDVRAGQYYLYPRVSLPGDYFGSENSPNIFGSARLGPDLSYEGGQHPDDWHRAHFFSARYVDPLSIMPRLSFLTEREVEDLITFVQLRSGKSGLLRLAGQEYMKKLHLTVNNLPEPPRGFQGAAKSLADVWKEQVKAPDPVGGSVDGLDFPDPINLNIVDRSYWLANNPLPVTKDNLVRGREIFQERCIGCHGEGGAAIGQAARFMSPMPINFTKPGDARSGNDTSPGAYYYRILRGIPGTAMENFGSRLRVDDIWKVVLFVKTIPNGGLIPDELPTPDTYIQWRPPAQLLEYVDKHPIGDNQGFIEKEQTKDPFMFEAKLVLAGMNEKDRFDVPGFGEASLKAARDEIKRIYEGYLRDGWRDLENRPGPQPPAGQKDGLPEIIEQLQ